MEQSLREELLYWASLLQSKCFVLNAALIKANKLDERAELTEWDLFIRPARAVITKLLPRVGEVKGADKASSFTYHIHGRGITIQTGNGENINFEYFPQPKSGPKPILGLHSMHRFVYSVNPNSLLSNNHVLAGVLEELFQTGLLVRIDEHYLEFHLK